MAERDERLSWPTDTLGYRLADIDRRLAAIAAEANPVGRWFVNRKRRQIMKRFQQVQEARLRTAFREMMGRDLPE